MVRSKRLYIKVMHKICTCSLFELVMSYVEGIKSLMWKWGPLYMGISLKSSLLEVLLVTLGKKFPLYCSLE